MDSLPTMDLSEQRFYYLSKPECHADGCAMSEEGSWYGDGFEAAKTAAEPIVPLEASCPYSSQPGPNDVQVPQLDSCEEGALKVVQLKSAKTPQEIVNALHEYRLPVPFRQPAFRQLGAQPGAHHRRRFGPYRRHQPRRRPRLFDRRLPQTPRHARRRRYVLRHQETVGEPVGASTAIPA